MDYKALFRYLIITDSREEMEAIGRRIVAENETLYTPLMLEKLRTSVAKHLPDTDENEREVALFRSIYDYWVYGNNVDEEFYLHFNKMSDREKRKYISGNLRFVYAYHLNSDGDQELFRTLTDKYLLSQRLKRFYRREVIKIESDEDFPEFERYVRKHDVFVVKPCNFFYGIGVHKDSLRHYGNDARKAFDSILEEGAAIRARHLTRNPKMVLEELIPQDPILSELHSDSLNVIRATAVRGKDGKTHLYHPWIKAGINGSFVATAAQDGFIAEIDADTGVVITDGYQETGKVYQVHPNSGIRIKGFQIPKWEELLVMVQELMAELPEYGYIGWDLALTPEGWCVVEGNYSGEFMFQLMNGKGYRQEFEELIGWKYMKDFWWQYKD